MVAARGAYGFRKDSRRRIPSTAGTKCTVVPRWIQGSVTAGDGFVGDGDIVIVVASYCHFCGAEQEPAAGDNTFHADEIRHPVLCAFHVI